MCMCLDKKAERQKILDWVIAHSVSAHPWPVLTVCHALHASSLQYHTTKLLNPTAAYTV
jgi:hypothetical protein